MQSEVRGDGLVGFSLDTNVKLLLTGIQFIGKCKRKYKSSRHVTLFECNFEQTRKNLES